MVSGAQNYQQNFGTYIVKMLLINHNECVLCCRKMFKEDISYEKYNYRSLIEMCSDLPEIFHYLQLTSSDFMLYDKNKPIPSLDQNDKFTDLSKDILKLDVNINSVSHNVCSFIL
jgi:hypothetical protein